MLQFKKEAEEYLEKEGTGQSDNITNGDNRNAIPVRERWSASNIESRKIKFLQGDEAYT
jgi:hypothetical protein